MKPCAACGGATVSHAAIWVSNSGDMVALGFAGLRTTWIVRTLSGIGEWALSLLGHLAFHIARIVGAVSLSDDFSKVRSDRARVMWEDALRRGIPMEQLFLFGAPADTYRIRIHGKTYFVDSIPTPPKKQKEALHIDDKISFKAILRKAGIATPRSIGTTSLSTAKKTLKEFGTVCVKPRYGSNGYHTYPFVKTEKELEDAFKSAKELCYMVSVEEHLEGNVCRATCIDGKLVGFLESQYPTVVGDGVHTVAELIQKNNEARRDGVAEIVVNYMHEGYIGRRGYTLESVLPEGVSLPLTYRAGSSSGGSNREYGRNIHPSFIPIIEHAAALTELPIVGFDLIIKDPLASADSQAWGFIEANSLPWINLHHTPFEGEPVNVATHVWDLWKD